VSEELTRVNPFGLGTPSEDGGWHGHVFTHGGVFGEIPTTLDQLAEIVAQDESDPDDWEGTVVAVVKLKDGRFMSWESFWGPTGDGFHEDAYGGDADVHFAATLGEIIRFGLTDEGRQRLNLPLTAHD
jgi:hypothetical protein